MRVERVRVGKGRSSATWMAAPGRKVPKQALVAVLSLPVAGRPRRELVAGQPAQPLRREAELADPSRTHAPPPACGSPARSWRAHGVVAVWVHVSLVLVVAAALVALAPGPRVGRRPRRPVLLAAGALAVTVTTVAKWVLVGRLRPSEHPLWSSFVWRNELADTFVEVLAAPWFARAATGTAVLNVWLRSMGARVGRGVWCETYWLPEADLIDLRDGPPSGGLRGADPSLPRPGARHGPGHDR